MRKLVSLFFFLASALVIAPAYANQLVYVALPQPCRLLDTRVGTGTGTPLTAANSPYLFGTTTADISSTAQHGSATGCGIPARATAISVNFNMLDATASGNITTWSADVGTPPSAGSGVYNPQIQYNTGYSTIPVGSATYPPPSGTNPGRFYLQVANGQIDMTINVVGYWTPVSWGETVTGVNAMALGYNTTASGVFSTALGYNTTASGNWSTAMGTNAWDIEITGNGLPVTHPQSFVYGDGSTSTRNTADHQFMVRASGGFVFYTSSNNTSGVQLAPGAGGWTSLSDRNAKDAIRPVDTREVLAGVVAMPVTTWRYKTQDERYRHMGPMAQDFRAAFGLGETDKGIDDIDAQGVALAAIQGLHAQLQDREAEIAALRARVTSLESVANDVAEMKVQLGAMRRSQTTAATVALQP